MTYDLAIVGGGIAAFSAALYAGRFRLKTILLGESFGGTLILTDSIENYPGFAKISGRELFEKVQAHAQEYGFDSQEEKVASVEKNDAFILKTRKGSIKARAVLFATGTEWKKLGVAGEAEFTGNGVHYCALCDGYIYRDKAVAVVGGADSAAKEALLLSRYARKVYVIYRKQKIRAEPVIAKQVEDNRKIEIIYNTNVKEIKGEKTADRVVLDSEYNGKKEILLDGVFIAIGHTALSGLAQDLGVKVNEKKEIVINRYSETSVPGVFAAGDVTDLRFKQAITGVGEAVTAVDSAYRFLNS